MVDIIIIACSKLCIKVLYNYMYRTIIQHTYYIGLLVRVSKNEELKQSAHCQGQS